MVFTGGRRKKTILIADPEISADADLANIFRNRGYDVLVAVTAEAAAALAARGELDFALLELRFPDGDGMSLLSEIRKHNPRARVVVHTWFADVKIAVAVTKCGADDLLPKPLDPAFVADFLAVHGSVVFPYHTVVPDLKTIRREHIKAVYESSNRNLSKASRRLALHRRSLQRIMKRYALGK